MAEKIGQEQFHGFVFGEHISWQEIIYDLINSEQLDPWDINLVMLSQRYLEKIKELEEANFILSSKVLMVCSLLLRIKSELLISYYIKNLDEILFNKKDESIEIIKQIEEDFEEVPALIPKTPLPRFKRVSLTELMAALNKAINTETRRETKRSEKREIYERAQLLIPKKTASLAQRIKDIHEKIIDILSKKEKVSFSEFAGSKKEEKIDKFVPLLHLDTQNKLWLEQEKYLEEIWILKQRLRKLEDEMENEIITDNIERKFEDILDKNKINKLKEEGWEIPEEVEESKKLDKVKNADEFVEESELMREKEEKLNSI